MNCLLPLPLLAVCAACAPTLTNGRYQVGAAKVADIPSVNAEWKGSDREKVRFEVGYTVWVTRPDRECPEIGMGLRHGHHEERWVEGAVVVIEGDDTRHVLEDPELRLGPHWDNLSVETPEIALRTLVGGGHILVGEHRYELDDSVREALAELLENYRCKAGRDVGPEPIEPVEPVGPANPCAELERQQANALSAEEHQRRYGCPPCPCACVNGEIVCAPCAARESFGPPDADLLRAPEPEATP